jgi:hypothetical protein
MVGMKRKLELISTVVGTAMFTLLFVFACIAPEMKKWEAGLLGGIALGFGWGWLRLAKAKRVTG